MLNLARRARRAGIVLAVAAAAAFGLVAPAAAQPAAPPAPTEEKCTDPLDGATLCIRVIPTSDDPTHLLVNTDLSVEEGRTLRAALVVVELCSPDCRPSANPNSSNGVDIGQRVRNVGTSDRYYPERGAYRANASWVDDQQHLHTGVTIDL